MARWLQRKGDRSTAFSKNQATTAPLGAVREKDISQKVLGNTPPRGHQGCGAGRDQHEAKFPGNLVRSGGEREVQNQRPRRELVRRDLTRRWSPARECRPLVAPAPPGHGCEPCHSNRGRRSEKDVALPGQIGEADTEGHEGTCPADRSGAPPAKPTSLMHDCAAPTCLCPTLQARAACKSESWRRHSHRMGPLQSRQKVDEGTPLS